MDYLPDQSSRLGKILLVDDTPANLAVLSAALEPEGYEILAAPDGATALRLAAKAAPDLILLDIMMPKLDGLETCRQLKLDESTRDIPVIFITARGDMDSLVEGFGAGAVDYVVKPFHGEEVLRRAATHVRLSRLNRELREQNRVLEARTAELSAEMERRRAAESALQHADEKLAVMSHLEADRWNVAGLIGGSRHMQQVVEDIQRLNQFSNTSALILGESGTGKELIARAIHFGSARAGAPFVPINCVAIPAELAESMLFGHLKGAFTGATTDRKGYFELAHGGTLFLDEIGDMPAALQVKLLRVLEDGCVTPVGASQPRRVDVRVVAATNADLETRIASGSFRRDLYFRLARYVVVTPPLRERSEDVPVLAAHFLRMFAAEMGMRAPPLSAEALGLLCAYDFPGNVRELKNVIERALIESSGTAIQSRHLHLLRPTAAAASPATRKTNADIAGALPLNLAEAEDLLIQRALQETGGNIADAARLLGVHRTRIYRKLAQEEPAAS
jgi:DNA-binding NtrC family response regulator